jgi:hypothetical protein
LTVCLGQDTTKGEPVYCMPKRYADSVDYNLRKYDQLKKVHAAQAFELDIAWKTVSTQELQIYELDSLNSANVELYEEIIIPKKNKVIGFLLGATIGEAALILLILL